MIRIHDKCIVNAAYIAVAALVESEGEIDEHVRIKMHDGRIANVYGEYSRPAWEQLEQMHQ